MMPEAVGGQSSMAANSEDGSSFTGATTRDSLPPSKLRIPRRNLVSAVARVHERVPVLRLPCHRSSADVVSANGTRQDLDARRNIVDALHEFLHVRRFSKGIRSPLSSPRELEKDLSGFARVWAGWLRHGSFLPESATLRPAPSRFRGSPLAGKSLRLRLYAISVACRHGTTASDGHRDGGILGSSLQDDV